ncbi:MAG TPA: DUF4810 domain-containing protein [Ideonella sp.]|uniref:DUF4810 domain-containing protein n=1 Tax=Ideonella sp. TaxID=1929293 RepID=UPI002B6559AC|nr:DUF4810 domain-containing protein [Ideonella sp.]HSI51992.1 DUF4810 domain-containing protein [Ideonella sp.]
MTRSLRGMSQLIGALALMAMTGCAHQTAPLYAWGDFPRHQYDTLLNQGASPGQQIQAMEKVSAKAASGRSALPPGFRAHLGMLYLSAGDADRAREAWEAEKRAFPESAPFLDTLLQRLDSKPGAAGAQDKGNPA